jgi:hypothetical protein
MKTIPSGKIPVSWYMAFVCKCNDAKQSYLKLKAKCPIKNQTVKQIYQIVNN